MTSKDKLQELRNAYLKSASIVAEYGETYLPIFKRLEQDYKTAKKDQDSLTRARMISSSRHVD